MAVFTEVTQAQANDLMQALNLGSLTALRGIEGGIENTNYFATTDQGEYVLTLFERLTQAQLPFYLHLMKHLAERGILVVPDVICNAGGVTVSYFEWVQDFSSFFWTEDEINARLDKIMGEALLKIWDTADRLKVSLRTATFAVACERILIAREERGLYP